jgi:hypothetical protein
MMLHQRLAAVKSSNPYFYKDLAKAARANKFIGRGSLASSTHKYRMAAAELANCGHYDPLDCVFVSAEGNRGGRLCPDFNELKIAIDARVTFITDDLENRSRSYNVGEREVALYLMSAGYCDVGGVWVFSSNRPEISENLRES